MKKKAGSFLLLIAAVLFSFAGSEIGMNKNLGLLIGLICSIPPLYWSISIGYDSFFQPENDSQALVWKILIWIFVILVFIVSAMLLSFNLFQLTLGLIKPQYQAL